MFKLFENGSELGSLLDTNSLNIALIQESLDIITGYQSEQLSFNLLELKKQIQEKLSICLILRQKYNVIVANPPYMGSSRMSKHLSEFAKKNYPNSKSDLFAIFIERWNKKMLPGGYNSMVTMQSWMFLSSFEKMRIEQLNKYTISNLMHMENNVMGIAFGTAVTIFRNMHIANFDGTYHQVKTKDAVGKVPQKLPIPGNRYNRSNQTKFQKLPSNSIIYWLNNKVIKIFSNSTLADYGDARLGMATALNALFMRFWFEVSLENSDFSNPPKSKALHSSKKWFLYDKGGEYRKWYGNNLYVVNWQNNGSEIRNFQDSKGKIKSHNYNLDYIFRPGITWNALSSGKFSSRFTTAGHLFDNAGSKFFSKDDNLEDLLGIQALFSSKVSSYLLKALNPTINYQPGTIAKLPVVKDFNSPKINLNNSYV